MRAMVMTAPGGPEVLQPQEQPTPTPATPHDLVVELRGAGVNPIDTKLRSRGTYYPERLPAILGCDGAGVVTAVGSAVKQFQPGDAVYFCHGGIGGHPGTYAEVAVVDARFAAPKPTNIDFVQAAAAPLVLITAWEALHDRAGVADGQRVLVHGGGGGVGHVAVQLAKLAGCAVATTVTNDAQAALVERLGADCIIRHPEQGFVEAVEQWSGGAGVDLAFDILGGPHFQRTLETVRPYGDVVTLLQPDSDIDWKGARLKNLRISLELMLSPLYFGWTEAQAHQGWILKECGGLIQAGRLDIHVSHRYPLAAVAEAHRRLEAGEMVGKCALEIGP